MSDERPSDVLGSLPKTRPHRRSAKRGRPAEAAGAPAPAGPTTPATPARSGAGSARAAAKPAAARRKSPGRPASRPAAPAQPKATAPARRTAPPAKPPAPLIGTAVQAAAELAEIGLSAGARAVREMLSRLSRP